jgi:hypothetical protein
MATKQKPVPQPWTRPELTRLGKLADVGPGAPGTGEGSSGKS